MKRLQLLVIFLLTSTLCFPQQDNFKQLDSFFKTLSDNNKVMGTLVVSKNGQVIYDKSIGYASVSEGKKITKASKFRLASITKTFTATMVYQLVDEGKLKLTDKLSSHFPQIPNAENITIENLLTHSSGLYEITKDAGFKTWHLEGATREEMLARMQKYPGVFEPNEKCKYSNSNFLLLGYIIENIEKTSYAEVLQKRIADKLNLKNTYYGGKINATNNECVSYKYKKGTLTQSEETDMSVPGGAGGIVATPYDLVTFYESLFTGELMSSESFSKMITIKKFPYGSGIFKGEMYGLDSYGHGGAIDGFATEITYIPEEKTTIVLLANALNYSISDIITNGFLASQNKDLVKPMANMTFIELTEQQIQPFAGEYEYFIENEKVSFTIVAEGNVLKGSPNPNMLFKFKAIKNNEFVQEKFGIHLKFNLKEKTLIFSQAGINPKTLTKKQ
ncbi:serine hydrolase domain-containing protein [Flavivirga jejuensis]|uniref:Serine hydrolase domain-containing protein n=1 Tax=Flavivirga jejuensis TaxID=870487 RepID=A0ABT8WPI2_9FLAO|nr:serine hydrolase domain-containing protein [Flavivirga jejuensis]MDO5975061.1 serine hydrolase domain-containing protein [Flavivirga jejuensis]